MSVRFEAVLFGARQRPRLSVRVDSAARPRVRLCVLVSHPIQYFAPVFRSIAQREDIDLTVLFRTRVGVDTYYDAGFGRALKWDTPLLEGYQYAFLSKKVVDSGHEPRILLELARQRFDVLIVHGYNRTTALVAIAMAKFAGTRVLMRGDSRLRSGQSLAGAKFLLKRALFRCLDGVISIGTLNREYYLNHQVPKERIYFAPFCVSNDSFRIDQACREGVRECFRRDMNLPPDSVLVLSASKLTRQKRTADLIHAFSAVSRTYPGAALVIAGSGAEGRELEQLADSLGRDSIRFVGFKNQAELPLLYAACDMFVLPSGEEAWGLAVNEAMAAGLPVIVSDQVGSAPDLVEGRGTGLTFRCGDRDALASALSTLLESPDLRKRMGRAASSLINAWDVKVCAEAISNACHDVVESANPRGMR